MKTFSIKKEEIVYGTDSTSLEELEKLFKNDSYLIQIFGRAKHFIFDKYRKLIIEIVVKWVLFNDRK